jgi:hypothetical protein
VSATVELAGGEGAAMGSVFAARCARGGRKPGGRIRFCCRSWGRDRSVAFAGDVWGYGLRAGAGYRLRDMRRPAPTMAAAPAAPSGSWREPAQWSAATVARTVHQAGSPETHALLKGLGSLIPAERRATCWVIEIVPEGAFLTCALGVPLRKMSDPAASLARVPAAQEGGP